MSSENGNRVWIALGPIVASIAIGLCSIVYLSLDRRIQAGEIMSREAANERAAVKETAAVRYGEISTQIGKIETRVSNMSTTVDETRSDVKEIRKMLMEHDRRSP